HFWSVPSTSLTTMSLRPASLRAATTFEPMNPAPPVTKSIHDLLLFGFGATFAPDRTGTQRTRAPSAAILNGEKPSSCGLFGLDSPSRPGYRVPMDGR